MAYKVNWALCAIVVTLFLGFVGYIIQANVVMSQEISTLKLKVNTIENKPVVDARDELDVIQTKITLLKEQQVVLESKLNMLIVLATNTNNQINRHMQDSLSKSVQGKLNGNRF